MFRVMFVCLGNICRSAMAESVFRHMIKERGLSDKFVVDSAGTSSEEEGNGIYPAAAKKLREMNIVVSPHRAKKLTKSDYDDFDLFLCAEERNVEAAKRIFGGDREGKVMRLLDLSDSPRNIADPWWTGDFDKAYADIREGCEALIAYSANVGR